MNQKLMKADEALYHPNKNLLALKASNENGTTIVQVRLVKLDLRFRKPC